MYIGITVNMNTGIKHITPECSSRARARTAANRLKDFHKQPGETIIVLTRATKRYLSND